MVENTLKIATRKSPLARWQARYVQTWLRELYPVLDIELVLITTQGDQVLDSPLAKIGGKGLFVKELEHGMLTGTADLAVHSMKDVPVDLPAGLHLPVICPRETPCDAFVSNHYATLAKLPQGARLGTSSLRRQCQLRALRPDLQVTDLRGNVNTRLAKLDSNVYDAIILACAGLVRLGLEPRITERLTPEVSLPAIGQGAVGIECRDDDERVNTLIAPLNDPNTHTCVAAERAMNRRLGGGCQVPIAGYAVLASGEISLRGLVGRPDGTQLVHGHIVGPAEHSEDLGIRLAEDLLSRGADVILQELASS